MSLVAELPSIVRVQPTQCIDGILFYEGEYNGWFEAEYTANPEPWDYSKRAGEMFRIRFAAEKVRACNAAPENLLELGCSRGLMTERLLTFARNLYAADISATALKTCKARCDAGAKEYGCQITYLGTTAGNLPLTDSSLDLVTICDGLYGWWLSDEQKRRALVDVHRVLKQGGHVVLSDCLMNGEQQKGFRAMLQESPLAVEEVGYLYDKPWYKLESLLKKLGLADALRPILMSIPLAGALHRLGRLLGKRASFHSYAVLRKN